MLTFQQDPKTPTVDKDKLLFKKYWLQLRASLSSTVEHTDVCQSARHDEKEKTLLTKSVLQLVCVKTVKEAEKLYLSERSIWKWKKLKEACKQDLKLLSYDEILLRIENYELTMIKLAEGLERPYASVFLNIQRYYENKGYKKRNDYYKECMSVLYFSNNYNIRNLWEQLKYEYPDQPLYLKGDSYCEDLSVLYNMVANINMHTAGFQAPIDCSPEEIDFIQFVDFLSKKFQGHGMKFVATSLYGGFQTRERTYKATATSAPTTLTTL